MDIQQLIYFTSIAKAGTYSAAAKSLYISQPALSKSIKKLEYELNTQLFTTINKKISLTDTGKVLFDRAVPFIEEYNSILDGMNEVSMQQKGYLRLGIPYGLGKILFDGLIADFSLEYPEVTIDLCGYGSKQVKELLASNKIDIGACITPPITDERFAEYPLLKDRFFLLCHKDHPLAEKESVSYHDLQDEFFYMLSDEYSMTQITKKNCREAGFEPIVKLIVSRSDIIGTLVEKGGGIAIVAGGSWRFTNNPNLCCKELIDGENDFQIVMITRKDSYLPFSAKHFLNFCEKRSDGCN